MIELFMEQDMLKILEQERAGLLLKLSLVEQTILAYRSGLLNLSNAAVHDTSYPLALLSDERKAVLIKYADYDSQLNVKKKVIKIIFTEGRFLHVREIARILQQLDNASSTDFLIRRISPALSMLKRLPLSPIVSVAVDNCHFNTFWGSRDWLTTTGDINPSNMYRKEELRKLSSGNYFMI
jgi:hypothetical protein